MSYGKKAFLIGIAIAAGYTTVAIIAYFIYSSVAYSAYESEKARLNREYQTQLATVPANQVKRSQIEADFNSRWEAAKAEIDARKDEALEPLRAEYWKRMERAKKKRDSSDQLEQIKGSTDELRAESAWRTDAQPIASLFAREESDARDALNRQRDVELAAFEKDHPTKAYMISPGYPATSLLPSMSKEEFQQALKIAGLGLITIYIGFACVQAVRLSDKNQLHS